MKTPREWTSFFCGWCFVAAFLGKFDTLSWACLFAAALGLFVLLIVKD